MLSDIEVLKEELNAERVISLTQGYKKEELSPVFGRDSLIERICRTFVKFSHNNIVLSGPEGIGKKSIIYGVAHAIAKGVDIPELKNKRIYFFDCETLSDAFSKNPDQAADRMDSILRGAAESGNTILAVENIHGILWGSYKFPNGIKFYNDVLWNLVTHKKIQFIGTINPNELKVQEGFLTTKWGEYSVFLDVPEMTPEECLSALEPVKKQREKQYDITIDPKVLNACVYLSNRFLKNSRFPVKAISLLDEAIVKLRMDQSATKLQKEDGILGGLFSGAKDKDKLVLTEAHIEAIVSEKTAIPEVKLSEDDLKKIRNLEQDMGSRIIGQEDAIRAVANTIRAIRAGFGDNKRPDGVFYFVGPSGVGKTEFAMAIAETLFNDSTKLIRIDMSEFVHPSDVTRLIGAAPGYVGYDEGGMLTEWAKKNPSSIILLDEFEKAHPGCWDVFLQLFDAGRLTDGKGNVVDFSNMVIIMTSNVGSDLFDVSNESDQIGFLRKGESIKEDVLDKISLQIRAQLKKMYRPEFLNRIDEIIVFRPLQIQHLVRIADIMLKQQSAKLFYNTEILEYLAHEGYEPQYGARHLRRAIQNLVIQPLANHIINGTLKKGDPVQIQLIENKLVFSEYKTEKSIEGGGKTKRVN